MIMLKRFNSKQIENWIYIPWIGRWFNNIWRKWFVREILCYIYEGQFVFIKFIKKLLALFSYLKNGFLDFGSQFWWHNFINITVFGIIRGLQLEWSSCFVVACYLLLNTVSSLNMIVWRGGKSLFGKVQYC